VTAVPVHVVDAFTGDPFTGNPAAVVLLESPRPEAWMRSVAAEMNLSETAFVRPATDPHTFELRWFTPTVEVDLCGHATLASAHVLWSAGRVPPDATIQFATRSGLLHAARRHDRIELDFPASVAVEQPPPDGFLTALGVGDGRFAATPDGWYLVELADEDAVRRVTPDFATLRRFATCVVTAPAAGGDAAIVSRVFGPSVGIDEDPVTGSSHCVLATWWADRVGTSFRARQVSARGGTIDVRLEGDRVRLGGDAVTVLRGELLA
jgi:PhzF family phenazine biosynthesis protein